MRSGGNKGQRVTGPEKEPKTAVGRDRTAWTAATTPSPAAAQGRRTPGRVGGRRETPAPPGPTQHPAPHAEGRKTGRRFNLWTPTAF